ncbi:MAG: DUF3943 domain-containing protein [Deltaproteobacteria bacterium]|nr:DUF3943 domain-containing protein [Deltaproteobacteria bacterium]
MSLRGISSAVFAGALALATPVYAVDTDVLPGSPGAAALGPISPADSGFEQSGEPAEGEAQARSELDWLTIPPDPARHNLWVPTVEWATCLALTIPLFMIDPSFVNTGTVSADHFVDAWTRPPVWDTDGVVSNYLLHPIMGAEAYLTVRNRGYGPFGSFLFSTGVSVGWEYLFEAWAERPSKQDLLTASPIGSVLGEVRFQTRRRIAQWRPSVGRDALLILVDPVEALHRYIGKTFLNRASDATVETVGSSLDVGPDQARVMLTMQF